MNWIVEAGLVVPWVVIAALSWLLQQILSAQRHVLVSHERLESQLNDVEIALLGLQLMAPAQQTPPPSLSAGTPAPGFNLPDLSGKFRDLSEFLGQPLVVIFFSPTCGFCLQLAPRLGQPPESSHRILLISRGDVDENLRLASAHKWRCDVLLDAKGDVTQAYRIPGTPAGYLLTADGRLASELAIGGEALLDLGVTRQDNGETLTAESLLRKQDLALQRAQKAGLSVTESRLSRKGLDPGTKAPEFLLPDLRGEKRSLANFLDKRVLLVFSDPNCGPCEAVAPDLVRIHQQHLSDNLRVVMVSKGDVEANRAKAQKHGFPFPVLLQKQWEISKEYAMFATPIAYLVGTDGVVAKPVAVGKDAILRLVETE